MAQHHQQHQQQQQQQQLPILLQQTSSRIFRPWDNSFHSTANETLKTSTTNYLEYHTQKQQQQQQQQQQTTSNCLNNLFNNNNKNILNKFAQKPEKSLSNNREASSNLTNNTDQKDYNKNGLVHSTASIKVPTTLPLQLKDKYKTYMNSNELSISPTNLIEIPPYLFNAPLDASCSSSRISIPFLPAITHHPHVATFNDLYQNHLNNMTTTIATTTSVSPANHLTNARDPQAHSTTIAPTIGLEAFSFIEEEYVRVITEEAHIKAANARKQRPKKFRCNYCNVAFANNGQLKGHLRIHTGERPYKCDTCNKTFTRNEELTRHKRIHTGLRPYPCTVCGKKFGRRDHLKKHMKTHLPQERHQIPSNLLMSMYPYMYSYV